MTSIARDFDCPKCDHWETYAELADSQTETYWGCRKCGWRVRVHVFTNLAPAERDAYLEALKHGQIYEATRGRYAQSTPGRRQYAHHTIHRLRHLGLIQWGGDEGAWVPVDTAAAQYTVINMETGAVVWYFPTEHEAKVAMVRARREYTYAAPGYVPRVRTMATATKEV